MDAKYVKVEPVIKSIPFTYASWDLTEDARRHTARVLITLDGLIPFGQVLEDILVKYHAKTGKNYRIRSNLLKDDEMMHYCVDELLDIPRTILNVKSEKNRSKLLKDMERRNKKSNTNDPLKPFGKYTHILLEDYFTNILSTGYSRFTYGQELEFKNLDGDLPESINGLDPPLIYKIVLEGPIESTNTITEVINSIIDGEEEPRPKKRTVTYHYP